TDSTGGFTYFPNRTASSWWKFKAAPDTGTYSYKLSDAAADKESGKAFDSNSAPFYFYYMPSVAVNSRGDMVIGFSGSRSDTHIGAYYAGRLASDAPGTLRDLKP